jgi:hypothetical protein
MQDRTTASSVLQAATGGQQPLERDTLLFTRSGWTFGPPVDVVGSDPESTTFGQIWFNEGESKLKIRGIAGIYESPPFTLVP